LWVSIAVTAAAQLGPLSLTERDDASIISGCSENYFADDLFHSFAAVQCAEGNPARRLVVRAMAQCAAVTVLAYHSIGPFQ